MRTRKGLFGIAGGIIILVIIVWYSGVIEGYEKTYEIRPEIRLPEHRTDAARAIDAYERLMERYMSLSERSFSGIGADLKGVGQKLDAIDGKLTGLSARIARIEKALGIETPKDEAPKELKSHGETVPPHSGPAALNEVGKAKSPDSHEL